MITWLAIVTLVLGFGMVAWGAFRIQANFFLTATHQGNGTENRIALTFDDGPHPVFTPQVLELLHQHNARATFFCIGKNVAQFPDVVKRIDEAGHVVGNHSYSHAPSIDFRGRSNWLNELGQTDDVIQQAIGRKPRFFRPPYGVTTPHLAAAIRLTLHRTIGWRVRTYDTQESRPPDRIAHTVLQKMKPGAIILLHDTHDRIVPTLEQLLPELQKRGFTLVTVDELINEDAYTEI